MHRGMGSGQGWARRREGISEVIGFLMILAAVVFVFSLYLVYLMPAMGREGEITQMNAVKESFAEYKLNIDTLWTSRQCTTDFGPALTLGSGETGGLLGFFPFLAPAKSGAVLAINQRPENITISSDSFFLSSSGGYTETRTITTSAVNTKVNTTPTHILVNLSTTDLLLERGILIDGPGWDIWVNITPSYTYTRRTNISIDAATGGLGNVYSWDEYLWNSTDLTVTTFSGAESIVRNLPVYRNIRTSTTYPVDLMNPVYGISTRFQDPQSLWFSKSDDTVSGTYLLTFGFSPAVTTLTLPLGSIEYRSNNIYYTPQNYYYQLGGVFLEQEDGSITEVPPSISLTMVNATPVVRIGEIIVQGSVSESQVSGSGPITVTSAVTDIESSLLPAGNNTRWVNLTVQAANQNVSAMWLRTFRELADRGGLPVASYTNGSAGNSAFINVSSPAKAYDIQLAITQVNVSADYIEEYSSGGISRSWRNVPGYVLPTPYAGGLNATTTTLGASTNTPNFGDPVTFTATVTGSGGPGAPTGTVTFSNGSAVLGSSSLSSGIATLSYSGLPVGASTITATYNGNSYFSTSTSGGIVITVTSYTPPAGYTAWYNCDWTHRKNITIDKTKVVGSLTDFPVLINLTSDADLKTYAKSNGYDILFTDSSGTNKISHQIEYYSPGTGGLVAWVKIGSLSSATNTSIYMYYGNSASGDQSNPTGVWTSGYKAVWHLSESGSGAAGEFKDSTSNANNGQGCGGGGYSTPTRTAAGKMGYGQLFVQPTNHCISVPNTVSLQATTGLTLEAWENGNNWNPGANYTMIGKQYGTKKMDSYVLTGTYTATPIAAGYLTSGDPRGGIVSGWSYFAMNFSSSGTATSYIWLNGAVVDSSPGQSIQQDSNPVIIGGEGRLAGISDFFDGTLTEVRIANIDLGDAWIQTEYNNYQNPSSFYSVGPQQSSSCAPAFVQVATAYSGAGANPLTATFSLPSTPGDLIIVSTDWYGQAINIASITDSKGNTYNLAVGPTNAGASARGVTYYANNVAGGGAATTITVTLSSAPGANFEIYATEYSGIKATGPLDRTSSGTGTGTTMNSGTQTTTQASELIYGYAWTAGTSAPDAPCTARSLYRGNFVCDQIVSSIGTYGVTGTIDASNAWLCHLATFKGK